MFSPTMTDDTLAAIVRKPRGEAVIAALRDEEIYDDQRQILEYDEETIAIPVTEPPNITVQQVVRQTDPVYRTRDLPTLLAERGWSEAEIKRAPSSWAVLGSVILITVTERCPDETELGEALLELHGNAETVLAREGIEGPRRHPDHRVIAGTGNTETIHEEHGIKYAMDLMNVMFSPGNKHERARLAALVATDSEPPAAGEIAVPDQVTSLTGGSETVFDMFAGIGYFTLPMAAAGATVTATEINPTAFRYLVENAKLNDVGDRLQPYLADCREVPVTADRVVMGHYDAHEYLETAFSSVRDGGVIHYHAVVPEAELWERPEKRLTTVESNHEATIVGRRRVKTYAEGVAHVVVDARVQATT